MDFICIGATRAGTTWLYDRLNEHPDFSMTPRKELHYFDRSEEYKTTSILEETYLINRIKNLGWVKKTVKDSFLTLKKTGYNDFKWKLNYYYSNYNDDWYKSLFKNLNGITGDITPGYSLLKSSDIERISVLYPNIKIIYILRNPIYRDWSSFRKQNKKLKLNFTESNDIINFLKKAHIIQRSKYINNLNRYLKYFEKKNILIGFFDSIQDKPSDFLNDIVNFLGGDPKKNENNCNVRLVSNSSPEIQIPEKVYTFLENRYQSDIEFIATNYGSYSKKWLSNSDSNQEKETLYSTILLE